MGKGEPHAKKFVTLLHQIISDPVNENIIAWVDNESFMIKDIQLFEQQCLTTCFRTKTIQSFYRQLNMYSFRNKIVGKKQRIWFRQNFSRDGSSLDKITRKHENKKKKSRKITTEQPGSKVSHELKKMNKIMESLVTQNRMLRIKIESFEQGLNKYTVSKTEPQTPPSHLPKKSIIKKVDFEVVRQFISQKNKEDIVEKPSEPMIRVLEPTQKTIQPTEQSLMPAESNGIASTLMATSHIGNPQMGFRRHCRRNSKLLSIKIAEDSEQITLNKRMFENTSHNLGMSRAVTFTNYYGTSNGLLE